jgi:hypothetical protein
MPQRQAVRQEVFEIIFHHFADGPLPVISSGWRFLFSFKAEPQIKGRQQAEQTVEAGVRVAAFNQRHLLLIKPDPTTQLGLADTPSFSLVAQGGPDIFWRDEYGLHGCPLLWRFDHLALYGGSAIGIVYGASAIEWELGELGLGPSQLINIS